jgi:acyl-CoA synthetase (AMP-forming)/AMP-acid ligase II
MLETEWTIAGTLRHWAAVKPDDPCITYESSTRTWREVHEAASRIAHGLVSAGLRPQQRVMYLGMNRPEFFEILAGTSMAAGVTATVSWRLAPREMLLIISDCQPAVLFVESEFLGHLEVFHAQMRSIQTVIVLDAGPRSAGDVVEYEAWLGQQVSVDPKVPASGSDIAFQAYTSGTTGRPKGVTYTNAAIKAIEPMVSVTGANEASVVLVAMPVFHLTGSSLGILSLIVGARMVVAREAAPDGLLSVIAKERVTLTVLVPAVLKMMVESPAIEHSDLSSLDTIAYAGSPITPDLLRACLSLFGCKFAQLYGMTETSGVTALLPEDHLDAEHPERLLSAGRAMPGVSVRVVDPDTEADVEEGAFGEVWIKAPTNMQGYWGLPEETEAVLTADGYVRSGDGGYLQGGYLYLKDRIKDMIVSGGENVYPVEVENVLIAHPGVNDVSVIGAPSPRWGETVKAVVVREPGAGPLTQSDLIAFAKANLAGYKCPTSVNFVDELPRNPSGKVLKRVLREQFSR